LGKNINTLKETAGTSIDFVRRTIYVLKLGEGRERRRKKIHKELMEYTLYLIMYS
jgi:hypothetical protein